jgi:hypothetical protein
MDEAGPAHNENREHEIRIEELEKKPLEWLHERAQASGIPNWKTLPRADLVQRLAESSASPH